MIPPLLNDFIGLQKDTVLVSFIGVVEIFRQTQIIQAAHVQLHAATGDGAGVPGGDDPAGAVHRLAAAAREGSPRCGGVTGSTAGAAARLLGFRG